MVARIELVFIQGAGGGATVGYIVRRGPTLQNNKVLALVA